MDVGKLEINMDISNRNVVIVSLTVAALVFAGCTGTPTPTPVGDSGHSCGPVSDVFIEIINLENTTYNVSIHVTNSTGDILNQTFTVPPDDDQRVVVVHQPGMYMVNATATSTNGSQPAPLSREWNVSNGCADREIVIKGDRLHWESFPYA
jgi:hypothetical protein